MNKFPVIPILFLMISYTPKAHSQNVGIGVITPQHKLDVSGAINSSTEYRLFGKTFFRGDYLNGNLYINLYAGDSAGVSNTTGFLNTFFGGAAGRFNTNGYRNCFIGSLAGYLNASGYDNTFVGTDAGYNSTGSQNTFLGSSAGSANTSGYNNTFLGNVAGSRNTFGIQNTFIGASSGDLNETGNENIFIGHYSGENNKSGAFNTLIGTWTNVASAGLNNSTAIGYRAFATQNNSLILGSINGVNGAIADTRVGIGTTNPGSKLDVQGDLNLNGPLKINNVAGTSGQFLASGGPLTSPTWQTIATNPAIGFLAIPSNNVVLASTIFTSLSPFFEEYDHGSNFNPVTGEFIVSSAGVYQFQVSIVWASGINVDDIPSQLRIFKNGSIAAGGQVTRRVTTNISYGDGYLHTLNMSVVVGDIITFRVSQVSSGSLTVNGGVATSNYSTFSGFKVY